MRLLSLSRVVVVKLLSRGCYREVVIVIEVVNREVVIARLSSRLLS